MLVLETLYVSLGVGFRTIADWSKDNLTAFRMRLSIRSGGKDTFVAEKSASSSVFIDGLRVG